jgi:hypothetical protein
MGLSLAVESGARKVKLAALLYKFVSQSVGDFSTLANPRALLGVPYRSGEKIHINAQRFAGFGPFEFIFG